MYVKSISLRNFKNYEDSFFEFESIGSLIIGKNGIGKTNLLEAISYFTYGKSIMNNQDNLLINNAKNEFHLRADFMIDDTSNLSTIGCKAYYNRLKKKNIQINNTPLKKISDLYQHVQMVYSGPDDVYSIFSLPAKRRVFMDMAISKVYPAYLEYLRRFKEALYQRNSLLKKTYSTHEKEAWDKTFCSETENVCEYREKFFTFYRSHFQNAYKMIVQNEENVDITLKPNVATMNILKENEAKERKYQTSLFGSHLDDFFVTINQKNAQYYASQGQKRSIVIALKIALGRIITDINKVKPIMIFDDTLTELDEERCNSLLEKIVFDHQVFIASPSMEKYSLVELPILRL